MKIYSKTDFLNLSIFSLLIVHLTFKRNQISNMEQNIIKMILYSAMI